MRTEISHILNLQTTHDEALPEKNVISIHVICSSHAKEIIIWNTGIISSRRLVLTFFKLQLKFSTSPNVLDLILKVLCFLYFESNICCAIQCLNKSLNVHCSSKWSVHFIYQKDVFVNKVALDSLLFADCTKCTCVLRPCMYLLCVFVCPRW